jgi:hypothetical protein
MRNIDGVRETGHPRESDDGTPVFFAWEAMSEVL